MNTLLARIINFITPRRLIFIAAYTLLCAGVIFFLVRSAGAITSLFLDSDGVITKSLSQLVNAKISVPVWIPLCGAAVVCILKALIVKCSNVRKATVLPIVVFSVIILLSVAAIAFLRTRVNDVLIYIALGIIRTLLNSGVL